MQTSRLPLLLVIFSSFFVLPVAAQISQGTLVFKNDLSVRWSAFDSLFAFQVKEIEESDGDPVEKEQQINDLKAFASQMMPSMKEQLAATTNDSTIYIFNQNQAVAERMDGGKPRDEFWLYNLDSLLTTLYEWKLGKVKKRVITYPSELSSWSWKNVEDSLVIDTKDRKTILGFPCIKYHIYHSHYPRNGDQPEKYEYELYVTDAIIVPIYVLDPEIMLPAGFQGCALEIKRIDMNLPFSTIMKATSFNQNVNAQKFILPEKFRQ